MKKISGAPTLGDLLILANGSTLRQLQHKKAARARFTLHRNLPAVGLNDALHDGQTQAAASDAAVLTPIEPLKDVGLIRRMTIVLSDPECSPVCSDIEESRLEQGFGDSSRGGGLPVGR